MTILTVPSSSHHHHRAAILSRGWAKASACCFHICLSCAILCQMVPFQYSSSSSLHRLAGLPLCHFVKFPGGDTRCPSVISYPADVPCPGPLPASGLVTSVCDLVFSLSQMFVFLSRYKIFNVILSIFVFAAANLFFAWVVSAHVSAPYAITGSTHEL